MEKEKLRSTKENDDSADFKVFAQSVAGRCVIKSLVSKEKQSHNINLRYESFLKKKCMENDEYHECRDVDAAVESIQCISL